MPSNPLHDEFPRIRDGVAHLLLLSAFALIPPLFVSIDSRVIGNRTAEISLTELSQEFLLLVAVLALWGGAARKPGVRGFLVLAAGFFSCALVRELDFLFDRVWHGFWVWPATAIALAATAFAFAFCRQTIAGPMSRFIGTKGYYHLAFGLVVLLVFSRTFGSGALLWKHMLEEGYTQPFKAALQEGLELFGYLFICYGSLGLAVMKPAPGAASVCSPGDEHAEDSPNTVPPVSEG